MKKIALFGLLLAISLCTFARGPEKIKGIPKKCEVYKPAQSSSKVDVMEYNDFMSGKYGQNTGYPTLLQYWDAYSDRDENKTYYNSNAKKECSVLAFKEKVRIARIRGDYALVCRPSVEDTMFPDIPETTEWLGWVPMNNLVLFDFPLVTKFKVDVKVLVSDAPDGNKGETLKAQLYNTPSPTKEGLSLPNCANSLFYLIKKVNGMSLLSLSQDLTDVSNIYGWVEDSYLMFWSSRLAIEPTWSPGDIEAFSNEGGKCGILDNNGDVAGTFDYSLNPLEPYNPDCYRQLSGQWRFPVVGFDGINFQCAIPGVSSCLDAPSKHYLPGREAKELNICFVLDGSRIYEPYYPILADFVQSLSERYKNSFIFNVSATIYHDSRSGDKMIENIPFSRSDSQHLYDFIDRGGEYGFLDNLSEAPILAALDRSSYPFERGNKNFVILIGGRGDASDASLSPLDMASAFNDLDVNFCALQVQNNPYTSGYRLFSYMSDNIAYSTASDRLSLNSEKNGGVSISRNNSDEVTISTYKTGAIPCFESVYSIKSGLMEESDFSYYLGKIVDRVVEFAVSDDTSYPTFFRQCEVPVVYKGHQPCKISALFSEEDFLELIGIFNRVCNLYYSSNDRQEFLKLLETVLAERGVKVDNIRELGLFEVFSKLENILPDSSFYQGRKIKELLNSTVSDNEYHNILDGLVAKYDRLRKVFSSPSVYMTVINGENYYWVPLEDLF